MSSNGTFLGMEREIHSAFSMLLNVANVLAPPSRFKAAEFVTAVTSGHS